MLRQDKDDGRQSCIIMSPLNNTQDKILHDVTDPFNHSKNVPDDSVIGICFSVFCLCFTFEPCHEKNLSSAVSDQMRHTSGFREWLEISDLESRGILLSM